MEAEGRVAANFYFFCFLSAPVLPHQTQNVPLRMTDVAGVVLPKT